LTSHLEGEHGGDSPRCGQSMRLVAFLTDPLSTGRILSHIRGPIPPPDLHPPRGPLELELDLDAGPGPCVSSHLHGPTAARLIAALRLPNPPCRLPVPSASPIPCRTRRAFHILHLRRPRRGPLHLLSLCISYSSYEASWEEEGVPVLFRTVRVQAATALVRLGVDPAPRASEEGTTQRLAGVTP